MWIALILGFAYLYAAFIAMILIAGAGWLLGEDFERHFESLTFALCIIVGPACLGMLPFFEYIRDLFDDENSS